MHTWHIITGEYGSGGVGEYSRRIACALACSGDEVHVWAPRSGALALEDAGVIVHRLPGHFDLRALKILDRGISATVGSRILVQYVPHAFGFKAMNLPFCCWLLARQRRNTFVMFHEVAFKTDSPAFRHSLLEVITRLMALLVTRAATRVFVSTSSWERILRSIVGHRLAIETLPVPSNVDVVNDPGAIQAARAKYGPTGALLVGHFSAHARNVLPFLAATIPALLGDSRVQVVLIGRGSRRFRQYITAHRNRLASGLHATGEMSSYDLSLHLSACDLMIQPYPDGITTRRTSAMAAIAHRRPVVSTEGMLTERVWSDSRAVSLVPADDPGRFVSAVWELLDDADQRERLGRAAVKLYQDRFDLQHTINALRE